MNELFWLPRDNGLNDHKLAAMTPTTAPPTVRYEHRPLASPDGTVVDGLACRQALASGALFDETLAAGVPAAPAGKTAS